MSAKKYSPGKKAKSPAPAATPAVAPPNTAAPAAAAATVEESWLASADPRRRAIAKVVWVALWIYVAALWLLALDQWCNWGLFGPKIPAAP